MTTQTITAKATHTVKFDLSRGVEYAPSVSTGFAIMFTSFATSVVIGRYASMFIFALMAPLAALLMILTYLNEKPSSGRTHKGAAIIATATIAFWVSASAHIYSLMGHPGMWQFIAGTTAGLLAGAALVAAFLFTQRTR